MRFIPEVLKGIGALAMASVLGHPNVYPKPGAGLYFFLATFGWPLLFVPLLLWLRTGPVSLALRLLEIPLLGWTSFMIWFAAGMDPGPASMVLVGGAILYALAKVWSDVLALRSARMTSVPGAGW